MAAAKAFSIGGVGAAPNVDDVAALALGQVRLELDAAGADRIKKESPPPKSFAPEPPAGDGGAATGGASGSSGAGQLPLPLPPRNGAVAPPRASLAATAAAVASPSGASPSVVGGGDALFLESELEKALYHWRAWKIDVVSFYVIGSLYLLVAVLIFVGSIMASRKSARSVSYAS